MLVKHLIRELLKCGQDVEVITEGCDCVGDSYAVEISKDGLRVMITRSDYRPPGTDYDNTNDTPRPLPESSL